MMDELDALREELEHYRHEKEKIRDVIGRVSGKPSKRRDTAINIIFLVAVAGFFIFDTLRYVLGLEILMLPPMLFLEMAVLLVSLKIIWMIHRQGKVDHFQFWILNSIEFQLNIISRRLAGMDRTLQEVASERSSEAKRGETAAKQR